MPQLSNDRGFLDLPAEVRTIVYGMLFPWGVKVRDGYEIQGGKRVSASVPNPRSSQLLRVCKTIHNEATPLFWATTVVSFTKTALYLRTLNTPSFDWIPRIVHLTIDIEPTSLDPFPCKDIESVRVLNLQTVKLSSHALRWTHEDLASHDKVNLSFETANTRVRLIAMVLLSKSSMNKLEDRSVRECKIVIELSTDTSGPADQGVRAL